MEGFLQLAYNLVRWAAIVELSLAGGVLLLAPLGLFWAPFAAGICGLIAKARKLDGGLYASAGAKASIQLLLPFFYVLARSMGWSIPSAAVRVTYVVLFQAWAVWVLFEVAIYVDVLWSGAIGSSAYRAGGAEFMTGMFVLVVPLHIFFLVVSARRLMKRDILASDALGATETLLAAKVYVQSLGWIFVGALMFGIYVVGGSLAAYSYSGP